MYRCDWGARAGQETVLAVEITRDGFEWVLRHACLPSYARGVHADRATWQRQLKRAPTRVQWDPERDPRLQPLPYRSLQLGLSGEAVRRYADEWTVAIRDVTPLAHEIQALVTSGDLDSAARLLPQERPCPVGDPASCRRPSRSASPPASTSSKRQTTWTRWPPPVHCGCCAVDGAASPSGTTKTGPGTS